MANLVPSIDEIENSKPYPEDGEIYLIKYLKENLDDSYEVYFQPFLNGDKPDIIIMKPNVGVYIIEVKDWNLEHYTYLRQYPNKMEEIYLNKNGTRLRTPFQQVEKYKKNLFGFYSNKLIERKVYNKNYYGVVKCGVYFHLHSENYLKQYFSLENTMTLNYIKVWGNNSHIIEDIKSWAEDIKNVLFDKDIYEELLILLKPQIHTEDMGQYLTFDKSQLELCKSSHNKQSKIKGVAGCGKSLILARRAVNAVKRTGSQVLILTFNITLRNYIRDRISIIRENFNWNKFEINHFHLFIYQKINQYNGEIIWDDFEDAELDQFNKDKFYNSVVDSLECIKDKIKKYNAIFIDEGQDYDKKWFDIVKKYFLAPDGEFVIFADEKQNIYHRAEIDKDKKITTNIPGRWNELNKSFRIGKEISKLACEFQKEFLKEKYNLDKIEVANEQLAFNIEQNLGVNLRQDIVFNCMNKLEYIEIFKDIREYAKKNRIGYNEICFISGNIKGLRKLEYDLRNTYLINSEITFEKEEEYLKIKDSLNSNLQLIEIRRARKYNFQMNSGKLKISTIHSFKGLEIDNLVLILDEDSDEKISDELIYTAITRCKKNLFIYGVEDSKYYRFLSENCKKVNNLKSKDKKDSFKKLDSLILRTLLAGESMLYLDMSDFLDYAINKTIFIEDKITYFENFDEVIFEVIRECIINTQFKTGKDKFYTIFGSCTNVGNKVSSKQNKLFSFGDNLLSDLKYYHVYYNGYIRTTFNILFYGHNDGALEEYRSFDIDDVITRFKYYLELFSINKLRYSYEDCTFGEFDEKKERELEHIKRLMIKAHCGKTHF
ncbi:NERD domain-containing protein [Clostridium perfringens]|uniref:Uncharacterized protein n=5 Tax=Clostridium perfringens TaxID=1502 RepID=A0A0H2YQP9_CLOP1|nr:NERD domain-containing protein [Clostridium perfringens]ABG83313.1 conserved hypothetical protein [Clostridium perfringens ATCC 13124]MDB2068800.1 NERD domain-containing protein [Clostridium perfringens]MDK0742295.1 NERD domain-containing protein [Clostridium perfringens]MDK0986598.1 NERD domain-containing protein [Clostridium perfringens]MDM0667996.1 NERD domain-containing protein [Clostridium perfringens]